MGTEIERKFLVPGAFPRPDRGRSLRQGYLCRGPDRSVRIRVGGDQAWLTVKGRTVGASRPEFEYSIPVADAVAMLDRLCEPGQVHKVRYEVEHAGLTWEVDVFEGDNTGLVVAEVELRDATQVVTLPPWVGAEVTEDPRYLNANLGRHPYTQWHRD